LWEDKRGETGYTFHSLDFEDLRTIGIIAYLEALEAGKQITKIYLNTLVKRAIIEELRRLSQYRPTSRKSDPKKPKARKAQWVKRRKKKQPAQTPDIETLYHCNLCQICTYRPSYPSNYCIDQAWRNLYVKLDRIKELEQQAIFLNDPGPRLLDPDPELQFSYPPMHRLPWYMKHGHHQGISVWEPTPEKEPSKPRRRPPILVSFKEDTDRAGDTGGYLTADGKVLGEWNVVTDLAGIVTGGHECTLALAGECTAKGAGRWSFYYIRALEIQERMACLIDAHLYEIDRSWKRLNRREQILVGSKVFDRASFAEVAWILNISKG
jgi:hypothetical protein